MCMCIIKNNYIYVYKSRMQIWKNTRKEKKNINILAIINDTPIIRNLEKDEKKKNIKMRYEVLNNKAKFFFLYRVVGNWNRVTLEGVTLNRKFGRLIRIIRLDSRVRVYNWKKKSRSFMMTCMRYIMDCARRQNIELHIYIYIYCAFKDVIVTLLKILSLSNFYLFLVFFKKKKFLSLFSRSIVENY